MPMTNGPVPAAPLITPSTVSVAEVTAASPPPLPSNVIPRKLPVPLVIAVEENSSGTGPRAAVEV